MMSPLFNFDIISNLIIINSLSKKTIARQFLFEFSQKKHVLRHRAISGVFKLSVDESWLFPVITHRLIVLAPELNVPALLV